MHPKNLDSTFDLRHASRRINIPSSDRFHGGLLHPLHMETEFDLTSETVSTEWGESERDRMQ